MNINLINTIELALQQITSGPWFLTYDENNLHFIAYGTEGDLSDTYDLIDSYSIEDYKFIANCRQWIPILIDRIKLLENSIRKFRDVQGHENCHLNKLELFALLPEGLKEIERKLPPKPEFLQMCEKFYDETEIWEK